MVVGKGGPGGRSSTKGATGSGTVNKDSSSLSKDTGRRDGSVKRKISSTGDSRDSKAHKNGDSDSEDQMGADMSVSESLHGANSVLYNDVDTDNSPGEAAVFEAIAPATSGVSDVRDHVGLNGSSGAGSIVNGTNIAPDKAPTNSDILAYLKSMDGKITQMDKRLGTLDTLQKQVSGFEGELKRLWLYVHDNVNNSADAASKSNDRIENLEMNLGLAQSNIDQLRTNNDNLHESMNYLTSQSMRCNLVFSNIFEPANEKPHDTEHLLRDFLVDEMNIAREMADSIKLERVHRMGEPNRFGKRNIVAKFTYFKEREVIRRAGVALRGSNFYVNEQFPRDIAERRRRLQPRLASALREGRKAWIAYDKLYIDGKPVANSHTSRGGNGGDGARRGGGSTR